MAKALPIKPISSIEVIVNGPDPVITTFPGSTVTSLNAHVDVTEHDEFGRPPFRRTVTTYTIIQEEDL